LLADLPLQISLLTDTGVLASADFLGILAAAVSVAGILAIAGIPDFADVPAVSAFLLLRHPFFWCILIFDYHIWILLKPY
jgi:hypothetical protein